MRMNISVPDGLRKRMDKLKQDVNWSALACGAFESHLAEVAAREKENFLTPPKMIAIPALQYAFYSWHV